jgi:hypothetical protein
MKQVHFFGCSHTAGDELSDEEFFPWKKDCATKEEYYARKNQLLSDPSLVDEYLSSNKNKAYPALIADNEIATYNHAVNGASLREMIFKAIQLIEQQVITDTSIVYFQIPPCPREVYINHLGISSIQMAGTGLIEKEEINNYKKSKWLSHDIILDQSANDILDIILLKGFFASKNIPIYFLLLSRYLQNRIRDIQSPNHSHNYDYLNKLLLKNPNGTIWLSDLDSCPKLLAGHDSPAGHAIIAKELKKHILENKY